MDLFPPSPPGRITTPLAERMRPRVLAEVVGQEHLIGPDRFLSRLLHSDRIPSLILWGPPGSGKTTLARVIAAETKRRFVGYSAVMGSTAAVKEVVESSRLLRQRQGEDTILFIDEIHRFNKAQQDAFLPSVEDGTITLIGATTENPSFEVIAPLLSRCQVLTLEPLEDRHLATLVRRALTDVERGLGGVALTVDDDAVELLAEGARGDARRALTILETAADLALQRPGHRLDAEALAEAMQEKMLTYDRAGEEHYNVVSAFIKSMRGSDPDAALYWGFRMLQAGEDPRFIFRRMLIFAAEDVGNADPWALILTASALQTFDVVGLPEGEIPLAQAIAYLACAPKSNAAYLALHAAKDAIKRHGALPTPLKLRNAPTRLMKNLGYSRSYVYPHDAADSYSPEHYLPEALKGQRFYAPKDRGYEQKIATRLAWWRARREEADRSDPAEPASPPVAASKQPPEPAE